MLDILKGMLGIEPNDTDLDTKLQWLLKSTTQRLKILLGNIEPPEELQYIIIDVAIIRFNRIGSEGLTSHSVEGESLSFTDDDFKGYKDDIQAFLDTQKESKKGKVRFL